MHEFFEIVAQSETGSSLPWEILSRYVLAEMGDFGAEALATTDLRTTCLLASHPEARQLSYETVALNVQGARARLSNHLAMPPGVARSWLEQMTLSLMVDGCRAAGGAQWTPLELHVTDGVFDGLEEFLSDRTVVRYDAPEVAVVFPTEQLTQPMRRDDLAAASVQSGPRLDQSISRRIEALLDASTGGSLPTLEALAEMTDVSPRTLQRKLGEEGLTYFAVVDGWRCSRALQMVGNPSVRIGEIAEAVIYSDASHFIRAFRRWTGVTPQTFRDTLPVTS